MGKLNGKVAVITGGNSGIGLAIARHLVAEGARVAVSGRDTDTLAHARRELGPDALVVKADVTSRAELADLFRETVARFESKLDVLFANAGIVRLAPAEAVDEATFDEVCDINLKGTFFTVTEALPHFNESGGSIVITSSGVATRGLATGSVYAATKAAGRSLARSLSAELAPRGIRVNTLSPGPIDTPILARLGLSPEQLDGIARGMLDQLTIKRYGSADEMARAAVFLASDDSSYMIGADLVVDGGYSQI